LLAETSTFFTHHSSNVFETTFLGLEMWEVERAKWKRRKTDKEGSATSMNKDATKVDSKWATDVNVDEVIDMIFSSRWKNAVERNSKKRALNPKCDEPDEGAFPEAVPLPQMVDILVDLWEAEGLEI
jgi:hypothetical protein